MDKSFCQVYHAEENIFYLGRMITKGNVHDTKQFSPLMKESAKKHDIDKVYGDKAYDDRKNFNILVVH